MPQTWTYDAFMAACQQEGCPFCRVEHEADLCLLDRLFYELVIDLGVRVRLRASLGFCEEHARMAVEEIQGKALGLTIIYDDLLRVAMEQLEARQTILKPEKKCLACENQAEMTGYLLAELSKHILEPPMQAALKNSQGLCLAHLRQSLEHLRGSDKRNALIGIQRGIMEKLRAELAEYIRKNDYRFAGEEFGTERDAWKRAVRLGKR
jgi:hypothetical protein